MRGSVGRGSDHPVPVPDQTARRLTPRQGDQAAALVLAEAAGAAGTGPVTEPVEPLGVEAGEPLAHRLGMTPQGGGDHSGALPVPTAHNHLRPPDPVTRRVPAPSQLPDVAFLHGIM